MSAMMDVAALLHFVRRCGDERAILAAESVMTAELCGEAARVVEQLTALERGDLLAELLPLGLLDDPGAAPLAGALRDAGVQLTTDAALTIAAQFPALDVPSCVALDVWTRAPQTWAHVVDDAATRRRPRLSWTDVAAVAVVRQHIIDPAQTIDLGNNDGDSDGGASSVTLHAVLSCRANANANAGWLGEPADHAWHFPFAAAINDVLAAAVEGSWRGGRGDAGGAGDVAEALRCDLIDAAIDWLQSSVESDAGPRGGGGSEGGGDDGRLAAAQSALLALLYNEPDTLEAACVRQALAHPDSPGGASIAAVANPKAVSYALQAPLAQVHLALSAVSCIVAGEVGAARAHLHWLGVAHAVTLTEERQRHQRPSTPVMRQEMGGPDFALAENGSGSGDAEPTQVRAPMRIALFRPAAPRGTDGAEAEEGRTPLPPRWCADPAFVADFREMIRQDALRAASRPVGGPGSSTSSAGSALRLRIAPPPLPPHTAFLRRLITDARESHRLGGLATVLAARRALPRLVRRTARGCGDAEEMPRAPLGIDEDGVVREFIAGRGAAECGVIERAVAAALRTPFSQVRGV